MAFDPKEAIDFLREVTDAESHNRSQGLSDLKFANGEQWPVEIQNSRMLESRPCLTINKIDAFIRQVTNSQRQQRPRGKAHPVNSTSDPKIAEIITGILRHIEVNSDADQAYDTAFNMTCRIGWGYWRVITDYINEKSFDQDIYIRQIENPFTVYFDNNSTLPDGSDGKKCLITDMETKAEFKLLYPGAQESGFTARGAGDSLSDWIEKENIRIAEYFTVEQERAKLVQLSNGAILFDADMPEQDILTAAGISVVGDRDSFKRKVMWRKVTAFEVLEEKVWPGRWIPVIPTYGCQTVIDGKRKKHGMVRFARDPQQMYNFWRTSETESIALAPKAKWLMVEGQDEGHENEWANANVSAMPLLRYKPTDVDGKPAPPPERLQPEPPPAGALQASMGASADIQAVMGMYDPAMGKPSGPKSGTALRAEQGQSEQSNFHYFDNLTRSIKHSLRVCLDLVPHIYDTPGRVMRVIGEDGKPDLTTLNDAQLVNGIRTVLNDVTVGEYDIVMEVGPGFNTRRLEAQEAFGSLMSGPLGEEISKVGADLVVRLYDAPGMDVLADRLAAANPMSQIDEKSEVPPQAQMMIKQLQSQVQQAQQQITALEMDKKYGMSVKQMQEQAETQRTHMELVTKAHDVDSRERTSIHDTDTRSRTAEHDIAAKERTAIHDTQAKVIGAQSVEEIKGHIALLLAHLDAKSAREVQEQSADNAV